jgi:hypothetical protein
MKTKLFSILTVLILTGSLAIAQSAEKAKTSFGILGGVNFQTFNGKDGSGDKVKNDILIAYHAGINIAIPVAPEFFFQPGILFSLKGSKNTGSSVTSSYKLSYIEIPLNLVYKGLLGSGFVMVGFGPYVAYAVNGKAAISGGDITYEPAIEFKSTVDIGDPATKSYFKSLDAGGNIFVGYEMGAGISLQLNAQLGMINIKPEDNRILFADNSILKNTGFGLSLGYRF